MTEKDKIYENVWSCAHRRRYTAKCNEDWELYRREQQTIVMCLRIAKWTNFDSEKPQYLKSYLV